MFRNLYGNYAKGFAEVDSSVSESDADSGTVRLETRGERLVEVSVELLQYTPHAGDVAHSWSSSSLCHDARVPRRARKRQRTLLGAPSMAAISRKTPWRTRAAWVSLKW